jgi:hypothetical protein
VPTNKADTKHITEGRYEDVVQQRLIYGDSTTPVAKPTFVRMVVLEVITDPSTVDKAKLSHYENDLAVSNVAYASVAPRNSIIARPAMRQGSGSHEKVMVLYPFFPPHLSFPAKPGEHVWVIFENPNATINEIGYWMCRIASPSFVEDVNYTHADRQADKSFLPGLSDVFNGTDSPVYEFRNGAVDAANGARYTIGSTNSLPGDETAYEDLLQNTDASKIIKYESVPRFRKRPADIVLEGSNNSLIVMGTDRTGPAATYTSDPNNGMIPAPVATDIFDLGAGSIDIVVGRGQTPATGGTAEQNTLISGATFNKELGKSKKDLVQTEGDVDLVNDRSRVLVSQKTKPDTNFNLAPVISAHASQTAVSDGSGEGAIVIKTDKLRLIARHDVVIMVTSATATDGDGNVQDPGTLDPSTCASIIIRANGDIIFTPAAKGVIKLGGDDAALAVLCSKAITGAGDGSGNVTAAPIVDTTGSSEGAGGANGQFSTKVLLK